MHPSPQVIKSRKSKCDFKSNNTLCILMYKINIFSTGISDTAPVGFCYWQVAILLRLLGITIIISPPYH
jgi:hypothetical protein